MYMYTYTYRHTCPYLCTSEGAAGGGGPNQAAGGGAGEAVSIRSPSKYSIVTTIVYYIVV